MSLLLASVFAPFRALPLPVTDPVMMAVDASPEHHAALQAWAHEPKDREKHVGAQVKRPVDDKTRRVAVLVPVDAQRYDPVLKKSVPFRLQMEMPVEERRTDEQFSRALRAWRGWLGLRHWIAFQVALTDAGRKGVLKWRVRDHMDVMGYARDVRHDPARRAEIATEVECFLRVELAIYGEGGTVRYARPLLHKHEAEERRADLTKPFALEGYELAINPKLYDGVGTAEKLGSLWFPAARGLARLSHVETPHALALGLLLPFRWRWRWAETHGAETSIPLSVVQLRELAGIERGRDRCRATERLKRTLDALVAVGALGGYDWTPGKGAPWSDQAQCILTMPDAARRILAREATLPATPGLAAVPATGQELRQWRQEMGYSRRVVADGLGVHLSTIKHAEPTPKHPAGRALSTRMRANLLAWMQRRATQAPGAPTTDAGEGATA